MRREKRKKMNSNIRNLFGKAKRWVGKWVGIFLFCFVF